jgi:putative DNA primase/helicase
MSPSELTEYILKVSDITVPSPSDKSPDKEDSHTSDIPGAGFSEPFRILGLCEGEAHFIDEWGFYQHYKLEALSKGKLNNLANLNYWRSEYPAGRNGCAWDDAIDYVVCASKIKEFDTKRLKGRGAWRSGDKICYNDGKKLYGEPDKNNIYLKDSRVDIGLDSKPASLELLSEIRDILFDLSFQTKTDAVRTMGWAALAPFCGALEYRPTLLMTGESGHGKSKVQTLFIQKITDFIYADMRTSSEAGIRRKIGKDSKSVFFDEGGKENDKMKLNFDSIMSFIRSNYSEDSPDGYKANMNGEGYVSYKMSSMFGLATTDPTIENVQDENRILRVHFVKPKHTVEQWDKIEARLKEILSPENCNSIRSLTWSRLNIIMDLAKKISNQAKAITNRDIRSSKADMLLASAYMVVWCNTTEPTEDQITDMLEKYYMYQPIEENRSEVEEYISRILDEVIEVLHESSREKVTILEALIRVDRGTIENENGQFETFDGKKKMATIRALQNYGVKHHHKGVHFANDNHLIKKITGLGKGYEKLFARHKGYVKHDDPISYSGGGSKRGTIIKGLLDKSDVEKLEGVF